MTKLLNFLLISSLTGAVTSSSTNLLNITNHETIKSANQNQISLLGLQKQNLAVVISERDLGEIIIPENATKNDKYFAVINELWKHNQDLNLSQINLPLVTDDGAIVMAIPGSEVYYGNVPITYTLIPGHKLPLGNVLQNWQLGQINSDKSTPLEAEIKTAIKKLNKAVNTEHISVKYITPDHAMVFGDNILYTGNIGVEFYTVQGKNLSIVLTKTDLDFVHFTKKLNEEDLLAAIARENSGINTNAINVVSLKNNTALVMGDGETYLGQLQVTFKSVFEISLADDLKVSNLKTIKIKPADVASENYYAVLMNELLQQNLNLQIMMIQVKDGQSSITGTSESAVIQGTPVDPTLKIQSIYTGSITIKFSFQVS